MTLKQHYASQLLDHNSASIAKTLLVQMSKCSFTEFRNELTRVLDTQHRAISKASLKPVTSKSIEVEEEDEEDAPTPPPKSSIKPSTSIAKKDKKINAQSAQIKDLRLKLDQAVAENSQIRELLSPAMLTMAFSNALSAQPRLVLLVKLVIEVTISSSYQNLSLESYDLPSSWQEKMEPPTLTKPAGIARTQGTYWKTVFSWKPGTSSWQKRKGKRRRV